MALKHSTPTLENPRTYERFVGSLLKQLEEGVDKKGIIDNIDTHLTWDENLAELHDKFPVAFKQEERRGPNPLVQALLDLDEGQFRNVVLNAYKGRKGGVQKRNEEWVTYGMTSYYSQTEASKIAEELEEQGFAVRVYGPPPGYNDWHASYLSIRGRKPEEISIR